MPTPLTRAHEGPSSSSCYLLWVGSRRWPRGPTNLVDCRAWGTYLMLAVKRLVPNAAAPPNRACPKVMPAKSLLIMLKP